MVGYGLAQATDSSFVEAVSPLPCYRVEIRRIEECDRSLKNNWRFQGCRAYNHEIDPNPRTVIAGVGQNFHVNAIVQISHGTDVGGKCSL